MIRGVYAAAAGMVTTMTRMTRLTNNIANVNTPGYRQDLSPSEVTGEMILGIYDRPGVAREIGSLTTVVLADRPELDLSQGALFETGQPLDLALFGNAFFAVERDGEVRYTRNGSFAADADGMLRTLDGGFVLGTDGPIVLPDGDFMITADGAIVADGVEVAQLELVAPGEEAELRKIGDSYLELVEGAMDGEVAVDVVQGALEGSNVDTVNAMVDMLATQRAYNASQRMLAMQDMVLARSVNDLGRLA